MRFYPSYTANQFLFKFLLIQFLVGTCILFAAHAQEMKPFQPRTSASSPDKSIYQINGDFAMIGNTNMTLENYSLFLQNNMPMIYVDVDDDAETFNSSSATLKFSEENNASTHCTNILFAGLYWTGRSSPQMAFEVTKNGMTRTLNKREVKLKGPGKDNYIQLKAHPNEIWYPPNLEEQDGMFAGYVEITDYVRECGEGEYTVADIALLEGEGGLIGYYGGWGMVVVYENHLMNQRNVVVFDGYAYVASHLDTDYILELEGFSAVEAGQVNVKMGIMAGEGDRGGVGDYFEIERGVNSSDFLRLHHEYNEPNNFFNATITTGGQPRNPDLVNNTGIDIAVFGIPNVNNTTIENGQTSTRFRYGSTIDTYMIFNITFSIDAARPHIEGINQLISSHEKEAETYAVQPGEVMEFELEVRNKGQAGIKEGRIVIPIPVTADFEYALAEVFFDPSNFADPFYDADIGPGGALVWEIGDVPVPDDPNELLGILKYSLKAVEDCAAFAGFSCDLKLAIGGEISGINILSDTPFSGLELIQGYENEGDCDSSPIKKPIVFELDENGWAGEACPQSPPMLELAYCNYEGEGFPVSEIEDLFPKGTRFFNEFPVTFESVEYDHSNAMPTEDGTVQYYAVLSGENNCFRPFTITHTSMRAIPTVISNYKGAHVSCNGAADGEVFALVRGGVPPFTFLWNDEKGSTTRRLENLDAGTYSVTVTDSKGCVAVDSVVVEQPALLTIDLNENESQLDLGCYDSRDGKIVFQALGGSLPIKAEVSRFDENGNKERIRLVDYQIRRDFNIVGLGAGDYILEINDTNGCHTELSLEISEPAPFTLSSNITEAANCLEPNSGRLEIIPSGGIPPYSFDWDHGASGSVLENLPGGEYRVEVTDSRGCTVAERFDLARKDALEVYVTSSTEAACDSKSMTSTFFLFVNGGIPPYQIQWDGGQVEEDGMIMITGDPGTYQVLVTDNEGCMAVESMDVVPNSLHSDFGYESASFNTYQSNLVNYEISFVADAFGEIEAYFWDFGDGYQSEERDPRHTYREQGTYKVSLTVLDVYGCRVSSVQEILIEEFFVVMPNAFTPDGDGTNDYFFPSFLHLSDVEFWVFNKWGETIYYTNDPNDNGWNGSLRGKEAPAGNYVYRLVYLTPDGRSKEMTGVFLLIR